MRECYGRTGKRLRFTACRSGPLYATLEPCCNVCNVLVATILTANYYWIIGTPFATGCSLMFVFIYLLPPSHGAPHLAQGHSLLCLTSGPGAASGCSRPRPVVTHYKHNDAEIRHLQFTRSLSSHALTVAPIQVYIRLGKAVGRVPDPVLDDTASTREDQGTWI